MPRAPMLLPPILPDRARRIVSGFPGLHVLVIGDAMLDEFVVGRVTRISPEAPVPVVAFGHEMHRMGGAANVAHNVVALAGQATLVSVTGQDDAAAVLARGCREAGIAPCFVSDPGRRTTKKVRIVTERNQQVARIDYETDTEIGEETEQRVIGEIQKHVPRAAAVIVSDYLKGCITRRVAAAAVGAAAEHGVPVLVDPKIPHIEYYAGATLVTPNHYEAEAAALMRVRSDEEAREAARVVRDRARCAGVLMTRGDQGMWLLTESAEGPLAASTREVSDVTGAGDTVIATLALALAAGSTTTEAARLANEAAGVAVGKFGPATVAPGELLSALTVSRSADRNEPGASVI